MKKNLLAVLLLTMLVGVAHAWPKYCKDYLFSGDDLCTTTYGDCSIQLRPKFDCVWGNGPECVPYDPDAPYVAGTYQLGKCYPKGMGYECRGYGEVALIFWKPLC